MARQTSLTTKVGGGGRIVLPSAYRRALGIKPGDEVVLQLRNGEVRVYSRAEALRRAQDHVCSAVPRGVSLVKELIQERRKEAARD